MNSQTREAIVKNAKVILSEIRQEVFEDLAAGGDGAGHRVINRAKYNVDSIINGSPMRVHKTYKVTLKKQ